MNLRDGKATEDEWTTLLQRSTTASNTSDFESAVHLFYSQVKVSHYIMSALGKLGTTIARINAAHFGAAASATPSDQAGGLEPVILQ